MLHGPGDVLGCFIGISPGNRKGSGQNSSKLGEWRMLCSRLHVWYHHQFGFLWCRFYFEPPSPSLSLPPSLARSLSLSVSLSLCLSVSLSLCLSVFLSLCLSVSLSLCLSVFLSLCLSVSLTLCLSVSLSLCLCVSSLCLSVSLSLWLSVSLSLCLCVSVSLCLCVSLSLSFPPSLPHMLRALLQAGPNELRPLGDAVRDSFCTMFQSKKSSFKMPERFRPDDWNCLIHALCQTTRAYRSRWRTSVLL